MGLNDQKENGKKNGAEAYDQYVKDSVERELARNRMRRMSESMKAEEEAWLRIQKTKEEQAKVEKEKRRNYSGQMGINLLNVPGKEAKKPQSIADKMTNTQGTLGGVTLKAVGGFDISAGKVSSKTIDNKTKQCAVVFFCPSAGAVLQASGNLQKVYSSGEFNTGLSVSTCINGAAGAVVGATGSVCTTIFDTSGMKKNLGFKTPSELLSLDNQTISAGGSLGAGGGASGSICPQLNICSAPK